MPPVTPPSPLLPPQMPPPMPRPAPHSLSAVWLVVAFVIMLAAIALGYYYYTHHASSAARPAEHLIVGVPYVGVYSGTETYTPTEAAIYSILSYWGDARFSQDDIYSAFPLGTTTGGEGGEQARIVSFFEKAGYTATTTTVSSLSELTSYTAKDIPVYFLERASMAVPAFVDTGRLLIGYSDVSKTLTFHDFWFGNNYQISYDDFNQLQDVDSYYVSHLPELRVVVVQPTAALAAQLNKPLAPAPYPTRLSIMDSPGIHAIFERWMTAGYLMSGTYTALDTGPDATTQAAALWQQIVSSPDFANLRPALQVVASERLALLYSDDLKQPTKAVPVMEAVKPLLSEDLNQADGEWQKGASDSFYPEDYALAWATLGVVYYRTNDMKDADAAFAKAVALYPDEQSYINAEKAKK